MLRFIRHLGFFIVLFAVQTALAAKPYQKSGAPVSLSKLAYQLDNSNSAQTIQLALKSDGVGSMQLHFSSSNNASIKNNAPLIIQTTASSQTHRIPLTVTTAANTKSYLNIFVTFTDHNGAVTSRALSAILNTGLPPALKASGPPPSVISMRAIETIKDNE